MSDSTTAELQDAEPRPISNYSGQASDWFLQQLVRFSNDWGIEMGITLQVSGVLVSGTLINGKKYFEDFSISFASGFKSDSELAESFKSLIGSYKEIYTTKPPEDADQPPPGYIHLKNARFIVPGQQAVPNPPGTLWRGRISEVGGFILGSLS